VIRDDLSVRLENISQVESAVSPSQAHQENQSLYIGNSDRDR